MIEQAIPEENKRFDRCLKLADFWIARYYSRLQYEWKVTLGLWALLAAGATFLVDKTVPYLGWWALAVIVGHAFWVRGIWAANERNLREAFHWQNQAAAILLDPNYPIKLPEKLTLCYRLFGAIGKWSPLFQVGATTILVSIIYMLAGSKIPPPSGPG